MCFVDCSGDLIISNRYSCIMPGFLATHFKNNDFSNLQEWSFIICINIHYSMDCSCSIMDCIAVLTSQYHLSNS